jgi:threonyl-tRNA synthetase
VQAVLMTITDKQDTYVNEVRERLNKTGIRAIADLRNEKVGFKIREHTLQAIPYLLVVGDREVANEELAVRTHSGEDLGVMSVEAFAALVERNVRSLQ